MVVLGHWLIKKSVKVSGITGIKPVVPMRQSQVAVPMHIIKKYMERIQ